MSSKINKIKKFKFLMVAEIVALFLFVLFFSPRKAFSEIIPGNYTVGEERYKVTMSRQLRNIISDFSYSMRTDVNSKIYANYVDENGNSFDFSQLVDDIEYDCNGNTCSIGYNTESFEMFNEKLGYINIKHGDVDATNLDVFLPRNFTYNSTTYSLDYYYSSFGCMSSFYFGKIYNVRLNDEYIGHNRYNLYPMAQYYTEKIKVDEDDDTLLFYWEHYYNKINVYAEDKTERNMFEEFSLEFIPYNPYNSVGYSWRSGVKQQLQSGYTEYLVPGNYLLQVDFITNNYQFMIDVVDKENIYYDNIKLIKTPYDYKKYSLLPSDIENSTLYVSVENLASSITIFNNTFSDVGGDKEFGYTITFDEKFNGNIFGIDYVDGVGKVYLKAGESYSIVPPKVGLNYSIIPDEYEGFESYGGEFKGITKYGGTSDYYESYYRLSDDLDPYYYGTVVALEDLVPGKSYVIFRATGGVGYMFTGKGNAKKISSYTTNRGGKVKWPNSGEAYSNVLWTYSGTPDKALFESFGAVNTYLTVGKSTSGNRPVGNEISYVKLETSSSPAIKVSNDGYFLALNSTKDKYTSSTSGSSLYFAEIDEDIYKVKFSGSNEGLHIYDGALDKEYSVIKGDEIVTPGIDNVKSPEKYNYDLDSWIDLYSGVSVKPGQTIKINSDAVYYAKWVPKTYDIGVNSDTVNTIDTNDFIKTEIYDYNEWFNVYSSIYKDNRWSLVPKGGNSHTGSSLGLVFFDNAKNSKAGLLNSVDGRDRNNSSKQVDNGPSYYDGIVTQGIGKDIIGYLFNKNANNYGVDYIGEGNHLYQYDEDTGFYYYDSRKNAASYNKSKKRFYVYDYIYGTSKSMAEGENGADFLPFNYMSKSDALKGKSFSSSNGATNYWFGLKSEIDFVLTDDVGVVDGNKAKDGNDMILKFSGDDDVWIYIDDKLVLDLGGAHDIVYGEINFSTGVVTIAHNGATINANSIGEMGYDENQVSDNTKIVQTKLTGITAGEHKATFYYVERGASRSNVSLYFNISDKYDDPGDLIIERDEKSYASFEKHEFSLELSDTSVNGDFGEVTFVNGIAKFKLLGGEKIKVSGLPAGIKYKIKVFAPVEHTTEFNSDGVKYETREVSGKILGGNTSEVQYKNNYDEYNDGNNDVVIPETKDSVFNYIIMFIVSIFISIFVVISYLFIVKKQKLIDVIDILRKY